LGTHSIAFAADNDDLRRACEHLEVSGAMKSPISRRQSAEQEAKDARAGGTYVQSFRPFMWIWAPDEERSVWQVGFWSLFRLARKLYDFQGDISELFGVGVADHKASTMSVFRTNFPDSIFMQCFTHVWRNVKCKLKPFQGTADEKRAQAKWFKNMVRKS
jgi:hypothetical protein